MIRLLTVCVLLLSPSLAVAETYLSADLEVERLEGVPAKLQSTFDPAAVEGEAPQSEGAISLTRLVYGGTAAKRVETCSAFMDAWKQGYRTIEDNQTAFYGDWLTVKCHALHWLQNASVPADTAPQLTEDLAASLPGWFTTDRSCTGLWKAMQANMHGQGWLGIDGVDIDADGTHRLTFETDRQTGSIELLAFADLDGDSMGEMILLFEIESRLGAIRESKIVRLTRKSGAWALFDPAYRLRELVQTCPDQLGLAFAGACATE